MGRKKKITIAILWAVACLGAIVALLLPEVQSSGPNSATYGRLRHAVEEIRSSFVAASHGRTPFRFDPEDFIPRPKDRKGDDSVARSAVLVKQNGVSVRWYRKGGSERILFYPIAVTQEVVIEPESESVAVPQIVMVPVDRDDIGTLPNLSGCQDAPAETLFEWQFDRMRILFSEHSLNEAIVLMSDGSITWLPAADVYMPERKKE
jgi:hypothetical protein